MNSPLHGGHPHSEPTVTAAPELFVVVALGVVLVGFLLHLLIGRYADRGE